MAHRFWCSVVYKLLNFRFFSFLILSIWVIYVAIFWLERYLIFLLPLTAEFVITLRIWQNLLFGEEIYQRIVSHIARNLTESKKIFQRVLYEKSSDNCPESFMIWFLNIYYYILHCCWKARSTDSFFLQSFLVDIWGNNQGRKALKWFTIVLSIVLVASLYILKIRWR